MFGVLVNMGKEQYNKDFQDLLKLTQHLSSINTKDSDFSEEPPTKDYDSAHCITTNVGSSIQTASLETVMHILRLVSISKADQLALATRTADAIESLVQILYKQAEYGDNYAKYADSFEKLISVQTEAISTLANNCTNMHALSSDVVEGIQGITALKEKLLEEKHQRLQLFAFYDNYHRDILDVVKDFREFQANDYRKFIHLNATLYSWKGVVTVIASIVVSGILGAWIAKLF